MTPKELKLFDFIKSYIFENRLPPSYPEMMEHMRLGSKSGIHRLLVSLEEQSFIRRRPGHARAIEIVPQGVTEHRMCQSPDATADLIIKRLEAANCLVDDGGEAFFVVGKLDLRRQIIEACR